MNKISVFFIVLFSLFALTLKAQETTDTDELDLVPTSTIKKYEAIINPKELKPNCTTDSYNNDSLYQAYNKGRDPDWNGHIGGFGEVFNNEMWFKKSSYKFELDTGTVWLLVV